MAKPTEMLGNDVCWHIWYAL